MSLTGWMAWRKMPLGDWGTWLGSIGTVATLALALVILAREIRQRRYDVRTKQAALVSAWIFDTETDSSPIKVKVRVRNGSSVAVYSVYIQLVLGTVGTFVRHAPAIGPEETMEFVVEVPDTLRANPWTPDLMFTDAVGQHWQRDMQGVLRRLKAGHPHFTEDPGVYKSIDKHPTMLPKERNYEAFKGRVVT